MAFTTPHQTNDFPGDLLLHHIQHQPHNHALQDAWVSLRHRGILPFTDAHSSMSIPPQVLPAPTNGLPEGHRDDIPSPVRNAVGPDPHHFDIAYQGVVDYHLQPLAGVSSSYPSAAEPPFDQRHSGDRTLHMCSPM